MTVSAKNTRIYVGPYIFTSDMRSLDTERKVDSFEDTVFGLSDKTFTPSLKDATLKMSGYYKGGLTFIEDELRQIFAASGQPVSVLFVDDAINSNIATPAFMTSGDVMDWKTGGQIAGAITLDLEIKPGMSGRLVSGLTLHPMGAEVGTINGTYVDSGAGPTYPTTTGWTANLHVNAMVGAAPSVVVKLQDSPDHITFTDLAGGAFTAATSLTGTSQQIVGAASASVNRYVRIVCTFGGTTTSITFAVTFSRNS